MENNARIWQPSIRVNDILQKEFVNSEEVKEVLVECFSYAHGDFEQALYILKNQAMAVGMDWDMPDKEGIMKLIPKLTIVAQDFRDPDVIKKNKNKILRLIDRCEDCKL